MSAKLSDVFWSTAHQRLALTFPLPCEFSAPEGAYVRKEQKAHLSPKNGVFLRRRQYRYDWIFSKNY